MCRTFHHRFLLFSLLALALLAPLTRLYAGELNLSASVNTNTVAAGDQLVLQVNVSGGGANLPKPTIPSLSAFTVYSAGTSQNMSFVNGTFSSSLVYQYVLVSQTTGKFTIPPITLQYEGKTYQTQAIPVEVVAAGAASRTTHEARGANAPESNNTNRGIFITASIDKPTAYVNEQLTYTFRFYTHLRLTANPQLSPPDFSGFWTDDTPPRNYSTTVNGQQYTVTEVKTLLFPTKPGRFTLRAATLQCNVEDTTQSDDFFQSFFSGGKTQVVHTSPLTVNVLPLPDAGKPRDFGGAVGKFKVTATLDRTSARTGDPVTFIITVTGTGNIKTLPAPALPDMPEFRKYETISSFDSNKDGEELKGSKTFKTVIIPQVSGRKTVPQIAFSYFDPAQRQYVTQMTPALSLDVAAGPQTAAAPQREAAATGVQVVTRDINYVKNPATWKVYHGPLYRQWWFIVLNGLPVLLFIATFGYRAHREKLHSDVAYARRRRASAAARRYLKNARDLLENGTPADFYTAIARALLEYIAHKTNVSADGLTFAAMTGILTARNVPLTTVADVKTVLDECDMVRFAPTQVTPAAMRTTFEQAQELFGRLEKELR
jgi:hypothetical protein